MVCSPQYFGPDTRPGPEVWRQLVTIEKNARFANTVGQVRLITLINCRKGCKYLILGYSTRAAKTQKQGNYSLRRPPKLIIPQIIIEQRWTTVYRFMCKKICISNKANMTRALMRVQFWVNGQYSPRTEPTEQPIFTQN